MRCRKQDYEGHCGWKLFFFHPCFWVTRERTEVVRYSEGPFTLYAQTAALRYETHYCQWLARARTGLPLRWAKRSASGILRLAALARAAVKVQHGSTLTVARARASAVRCDVHSGVWKKQKKSKHRIHVDPQTEHGREVDLGRQRSPRAVRHSSRSYRDLGRKTMLWCIFPQ